MSGPKKSIDAHAKRERSTSADLSWSVKMLLESPHIVNLETEIKQLKADKDKLKEEIIIQREEANAAYKVLHDLMELKQSIIETDRVRIQSNETFVKILELEHSEYVANSERKYSEYVAKSERKYSELEALAESRLPLDAPYVNKCLECGEVLHNDTRQLCGKIVCHNAV